jgi:hypothetical protein
MIAWTAEGEGLRQVRGAVAECENNCFELFVLIGRLTWRFNQHGDKTNPNLYLRTSQRTRRKKRKVEHQTFELVGIRAGISFNFFALREI